MGQVKGLDFFKKNDYIIPCFQREYTWDKKEIEELITDICNSEEKYCIGIVTIKNRDSKKVLIDGQQRLTTLYMIAIACEFITSKDDIKLLYETDRITKDSNSIVDIIEKRDGDLSDKYKIIEKIVGSDDNKSIIDKIKNVYYYEMDIEVEDKDLNHYFEVMNSRGVQLTKSDIIKSELMNILTDASDQRRLNNLWNYYETMSVKSFGSFDRVPKKNEYEIKSLEEILGNTEYNYKEEKYEVNTNSILDFEYFLLYVIRLYNEIILKKEIDVKMFELKDLLKEYNETFKTKDEKKVKKYLDFLIEIKEIYDKKIIKRAENSTDEEGKWSIKCKKKNEKEIIYIQSCLRVSFTNRKLMKWIYDTLKYFYEEKENVKAEDEYVSYMRNIIRRDYIEGFFNLLEDKDNQTGFDTPHIVLNYLDYLLIENKSRKIVDIPELDDLSLKKFTFTFRNSIEHFLPIKEAERTNQTDWVNDFGNLALLAYGTNVRMQDDYPEVKAKHFSNNGLWKYSIKLQIMAKYTLDETKKWNQSGYKELKDKYIELKNKCIELRNKCIELLRHDMENGK